MTAPDPLRPDHDAGGQLPPEEGISVLVPVSERPSALDELYREFSAPLREEGVPFEFLFMVESFNIHLTERLKALQADGEPIRVAHMHQSVGETGLLRAGVELATHDIVLTLPAYPRIEASEILKVIRPVQQDDVAMCVARRWPRRDSWLNRLQNKVFHLLVRPVGAGRVRDVACGVRAVRKDVLRTLPLYGDFHRFLPLLALREGHVLEEVNTVQHPRDRQPRIYSPGIYLRRLLDVLGLYFLLRFTDKPLRFFGLLGSSSALVGGAILVAVLIDRIQGQSIADRPMLLLGTLLVVLGVQAIALGLVGEIIVHVNAPQRSAYRLAERPRREPAPTKARDTGLIERQGDEPARPGETEPGRHSRLEPPGVGPRPNASPSEAVSHAPSDRDQ